MSDLLETLWSEFSVETEEHIEAIELGLLDIEQNGASNLFIPVLFRSFHSLKGLAGAMDLGALEGITHLAEDILGVVREGDAQMTPEVSSLLLEALDSIKTLRALAVSERRDGEVQADLTGKLRDMKARLTGGGLPPSVSQAPQVINSATLPPIILHEDADMVHFFIELVRENIPLIADVLKSDISVGELFSNEQALLSAATATDAIDSIEHAAKVMEFENLVNILGSVKSLLPLQNPVNAEQYQALTDCLRALHDQIRYIESSSGGTNAGSDYLYTLLKGAMETNLDRLCTEIIADLDALEGSAQESDNTTLSQSLHENLSAASSHLAFFLPTVQCNVLLMLEDVFGRAMRGELGIFNEIIDVAREQVQHVKEYYRSCATACVCVKERDGVTNYISSLVQRIHDYVWAYESGTGSNNPVETFRNFMAQLKIEPELLRILSPDNVRDLMHALEQGEHLYEIMAFLESNEEIAASFLVWVERSGCKVITNRSLFINNQSWYEMLMVSKLDAASVRKQLDEIDPSGDYLRMKATTEDIPDKDLMAHKISNSASRPSQGASSSNSGIRVQGEMLDGFMNQIGEMVLARSRLNHIVDDDDFNALILQLKQLGGGAFAEQIALVVDALVEHRKSLIETDTLLHGTLGRLQESAMGLRVVPVETVFKRLPRVVRDLSQSQGKRVRLEMTGQEVKIDKAMVEILADPLLHMVRNSVDHGIELPDERRDSGKQQEALIVISALQHGNYIVIEITDDGKGLNTERVRQKAVERGLVREADSFNLSVDEIHRFIFQPGFSTAQAVTETSGRGVGMDVVLTNVLRMGGSIDVSSEAGRGSKFSMRMPLSAAVQEVLMVESAGQTLALPGRYVSEVLEIPAEDIQALRKERAILLRGMFLPLHDLSTLLGFTSERLAKESETRIGVVLTNGRQMVGLEVDKVIRRQELFTKDIQKSVASLPGVGGASILGNGRVVLILDGEELLRLAKRGGGY